MFANIRRCLKPGGLLLLQGYTPRKLEYGTGGPPTAENRCTETLLRHAFPIGKLYICASMTTSSAKVWHTTACRR
jgi:hypothetical protein